MKLYSYWPKAYSDDLYKDFCYAMIFNNVVHKALQGHMKRIVATLLASAVTLFLLLRELDIIRL